jgi:DNA-binding transcriptional MerR regulator
MSTMVTVDGPALSVAGLAERVGVGRDTILFYEREGLLLKPPRTRGDHRRYPSSAVDRLRFIEGYQRLGLRLDDIRELLEVRDTGACACTPADQLLRTRLAELDAEVQRLVSLRADLAGMLAAFEADECPYPSPGTWCAPEGGESGDR